MATTNATNKTLAAAQELQRATAESECAVRKAIETVQDTIAHWEDTDDLAERKARHALVHALQSAKSGRTRLTTALAYASAVVNGGEYREPFAGRVGNA